jgi:phosphatidate cytidylyltransferase
MSPTYHELVMPLSSTLLMVWLLVFKKKAALISEISTSLLGMYFLGYLPSFWVRLHRISSLDNVSLTFLKNMLNDPSLTFGMCVTWWTWTSIVFAGEQTIDAKFLPLFIRLNIDVGAYFIGKSFGKHKLNSLSSAAGSASPNKTVEGALGGFLSCTFFSLLGAWAMGWPRWQVTGSLYGLGLGFIALVGDLTVSMMKRDAKIKDTGNLLPGHGGLLDRIDSYLFTAPAAYFFCLHVLPFVRQS